MQKKLFVGGLSYNTEVDEIRELFVQAGEVISANIIKDKFTNQSRGFGFVEMATEAQAAEAIKLFNGKELGEVGSEPCRSVSQGVECYSCLPKTAWPPTWGK